MHSKPLGDTEKPVRQVEQVVGIEAAQFWQFTII